MSETISNVGHVENFNPAMMDENRFSIIVDLADPEDAASAYYERYEASIPEERVDYYGNDTEANEEIKPAFIAGAKWQREHMLKKCVVLETVVMKDCDGDGIETPYAEWLTLENTEIPSLPDNIDLEEGDKVKLIIIKEDNQ